MWVYIQENQTSLLPFLHLKMVNNSELLLLLFKAENKNGRRGGKRIERKDNVWVIYLVKKHKNLSSFSRIYLQIRKQRIYTVYLTIPREKTINVWFLRPHFM